MTDIRALIVIVVSFSIDRYFIDYRLRESSSRTYAPLARPPPLRVCIFVCVSFGHVIHTKIVSNIVCKFHTLIIGEKKEIPLPLFIITFLIDVSVLTINK